MLSLSALSMCLNMCTAKVCTDGDIRLVDGDVDYEGRVEYCRYGVWGTVCGNGWTAADASVACVELGYPREGEFSTACISSVALCRLVLLPKQVQWLLLVLHLDLAVVEYSWLMLSALVMRAH